MAHHSDSMYVQGKNRNYRERESEREREEVKRIETEAVFKSELNQ